MAALRKFIFALGMICIVSRDAHGQGAAPARQIIEGIRIAQAVHVDSSPKVDGTLDDVVAASGSNQGFPAKGAV
jgi:hypothetical protein